MIVRPLQITELEQFMPLVRAHGEAAQLQSHDPLDENYCMERLRQAMIDPNYKIFVAEHHNELVGYAAAQVTHKVYNTRVLGNIVMFFVQPNQRNGQVSEALWQACEDFFVDCDAYAMMAQVLAHTADFTKTESFVHKAKQFYEHKGLNEIGHIYMKGL